MSALLQIAVLVDQSIGIADAQIENLEMMREVAERYPDEEGSLGSGVIIGWGIGTSSINIAADISKLVDIIDPLGVDTSELQEITQDSLAYPEGDPFSFIDGVITLAVERKIALERIKNVLLSDKISDEVIENAYGEDGLRVLEERRERSLRELLDQG